MNPGADAVHRAAAHALTGQEAERWARDGFFVRRAQFDAQECAALAAAAERAAERARQVAADGRRYELAGRRFVDIEHLTVQFEYGTDREAVKVIEPVHELDARLSALIDDPRLTEPVRGLLAARDLALWTDKLNLKRPAVGTGFGWHQDGPYWVHDCTHVERLPNVMVAFDDADETNGCLRVIPGSHHAGNLPGTDDGTPLGGFYTDPGSFDASHQVALAVPAGSLIFFSPFVIHGSQPNESDRARRAMVITYQPGGHPALKSRRVRSIPDPRP